MEDTYPPGPSSVPADLTKPTAAYKRHAYLAVAGLLLFVVASFALAGVASARAPSAVPPRAAVPQGFVMVSVSSGAPV